MEIVKEMSIGEVLKIDKNLARILMEFGMHCFGCPHAAMETLEEACAAHGANVDELIDQLNAFLIEKA